LSKNSSGGRWQSCKDSSDQQARLQLAMQQQYRMAEQLLVAAWQSAAGCIAVTK
jgi:hypothetical protein